jgi:hypothetical protein
MYALCGIGGSFFDMESINNIKAFLWWVQTYFEFFDETQEGNYLFEGPINSKNHIYLNPYKVLAEKPVYKKRNTQEEVLKMYEACLVSEIGNNCTQCLGYAIVRR